MVDIKTPTTGHTKNVELVEEATRLEGRRQESFLQGAQSIEARYAGDMVRCENSSVSESGNTA